MVKDINRVYVITRWRILQHCKVFRFADFCATDHRCMVTTFKVHDKSRGISRYNNTFHLKRLKDIAGAHDYAVIDSHPFHFLSTLENPIKLQDTPLKILQAVKECIGERLRSW